MEISSCCLATDTSDVFKTKMVPSRIARLFKRNPGRVFHYAEIMALCDVSRKTVLNFVWRVRNGKVDTSQGVYSGLNIQPVFVGNSRRSLGYYVHIPDGQRYGLGSIVNPCVD